jgi:general secretion pathway protein K
MQHGGPQEGMALLTVLWAVAILALISAVVTTATRTEINRTRNHVESAKAEALADAGVYRAIAELLVRETDSRPLMDGTLYRWRFADAEILVAIQSEVGKIDLNTATDELLDGLFTSVGIAGSAAKRLVATIRDFADENDERRPLGAEDADYRAAGLSAGAKDRPFESVRELQQVIGVTPELYRRVAPALTVYSHTQSIDRTTAPVSALLAMPGATQRQVDDLIAERQAARARDSMRPQGGLELVGNPAEAADVVEMAAKSEAPRAASRQYSVFTVRSEARTPGGGTFARVAVVRLTNDEANPFVFLEWHQGWAAAGAASD